MAWFNRKKTPSASGEEQTGSSLEFFENRSPSGSGLCSDDQCPCPPPGTVIPRGTGYMYIAQEVVDFRRDARTDAKAKAKMARMGRPGAIVLGGKNVGFPVLVCEQGAKLRKLDLGVAAADARVWWDMGLVPLRATPRAVEGERISKETNRADEITKRLAEIDERLSSLRDRIKRDMGSSAAAPGGNILIASLMEKLGESPPPGLEGTPTLGQVEALEKEKETLQRESAQLRHVAEESPDGTR
jgi:hypothetical protein